MRELNDTEKLLHRSFIDNFLQGNWTLQADISTEICGAFKVEPMVSLFD